MKVKVIGVLPQKNTSGWSNPNNQILVPITTAMYRLLGKNYYDSLNVEIQKSSDLDLIETKIKTLLIKKHNIRLNKDSAIRIWNLNEFKSMVSAVTKNVSIFLYFVSFIALLVGGIGIMNIMLVNVSERTKEIGVRRAMGATAAQIKQQFLIESIVLTLTGGGLGIIFGLFISICISILAGWAIKVSFIAIFAVTLLSIAIGIVFGYWPALQASRLHPVEALRSE